MIQCWQAVSYPCCQKLACLPCVGEDDESQVGFRLRIYLNKMFKWRNFSHQAKCKKCRLLGKHPREVDEQVGYLTSMPLRQLICQKVNEQLALTVDWSVLDCSLCGAFCCDAVLLPCCGTSTQVSKLEEPFWCCKTGLARMKHSSSHQACRTCAVTNIDEKDKCWGCGDPSVRYCQLLLNPPSCSPHKFLLSKVLLLLAS